MDMNSWRQDPQTVSRALKIEHAERKSGSWGKLEIMQFPMGTIGPNGWVYFMQRGLRNKWLAVLMRDIYCRWDPAAKPVHGVHAAYRTASERELSWRERQSLKTHIFGPQAIGLEIMPREDRIVDDAPMFHMWIFPDGFDMPFGIHAEDPLASFVPPLAKL
jgi:hypothetical protein